MTMPDAVTIYEVGPRDGLQNESQSISTQRKLELIHNLAKSGLKKIEATAFVSPRWVPQMADHADIISSLNHDEGITYPVLVPNMKGLENAISAGVREIAVFGAASETFSRKNINAGIEDSWTRFQEIIKTARAQDIAVRGYVSCIAGCPYEGDVPSEQVADIARRLYEMGCYEISLGDTIGVGTPKDISRVLKEVASHIPVEHLALHCHDTYGTALANIYEGLCHGVSTIDSSVGGLGGCPYAPGAAGNVATEDVVYMLNAMGIQTGVGLNNMVYCAQQISEVLGREIRSKTGQAVLSRTIPESSL